MNKRSRKSVLVFSCCILCAILFGEEPQAVQSVNTAAALRSLERATGLLASSDWQTAAFEARLGASYDPTIADFSYIEALSLTATGAPRADILERVERSLADGLFWRSYTKDDALVFCARLQAETLDYAVSLSTLGKVKNAVSSDADFVTLMDYYGLGQLSAARRAAAASLERWPFDSRFPRLFLEREASLKPDAESLKLAATILSRLYLWENEDRELLLLAVPFETDPAARDRKIRIYRNMGKSDYGANAPAVRVSSGVVTEKAQIPLTQRSAVFALEYGIIDESVAADEILSASADGIHLSDLAALCRLTGSSAARARIASFLDSYAGVIVNDANGDGIVESWTRYRLGRPVHAWLDRNQDGYPDYTIDCELGSPVTIALPKGDMTVAYDAYPKVRSVMVGAREYTMRPLALVWAPVEWVRQNFDLGGNDFFTIELTKTPPLSERLLINASSFYAEPAEDRPGAITRVTLESGIPVSEESRENGRVYSWTSYQRGYPRSSASDRDGDGYFETSIRYTSLGEIATVTVDRNANRVAEYREEYLEDGGVKQMWDTDENGAFEISLTTAKDGTSRTEWIHPVSGFPVVVIVENGVPRSVTYAGKTVSVVKDPLSDVWWIGRIPTNSRDFVKKIENEFNPDDPTVVTATETVNGKRICAVRTGGLLFAELLDE